VEEWLLTLLNSSLGGDHWSDSCSYLFISGGRVPRYPLEKELVWPQRVSGRGDAEKIPHP